MDGFTPSATTRFLTLLGDPVAHSLSPIFQNAAFRHCGLDATYLALRCDAQSVGPLMRALSRAGGGGNVTVPHKSAAAQSLEKPSAAVQRTGACNTFWGEDGRICGDNTDVAGFRHACSLLLPTLKDSNVLIVGAGGAAAAAVCGLVDARAARITLFNRSPDRATDLARRFDPDGSQITVATSLQELWRQDFDLVANASAIGMAGDEQLPLDLTSLSRAGAVLDLVYRRTGTTPWVRQALDMGIVAADGREMLLGQGAAAFEHWFGIAAPMDVMRAALLRG